MAAAFSWRKDKARTKKALVKAWKAFENIQPQFFGVLILVGILLALLEPETISAMLGRRSGWLGVGLAAILGAVTLIPGFVAFPLAAMLMRGGAGAMQMGAFISTLMSGRDNDAGGDQVLRPPHDTAPQRPGLHLLLPGGLGDRCGRWMKALLRRYRFPPLTLLALVVLFAFNLAMGLKAMSMIGFSFKEMLLVIPPIFILLGFLDVWVPRETMVLFMGEGSGLLGVALAILLGSAAAGPLYGAFPVAAVFIKKGASFRGGYVSVWRG